MSNRDYRYLITLIVCISWFALIKFSGCQIGDYAFALISQDCKNLGIAWGQILNPFGIFIALGLPVCILYFFLRAINMLISSVKKINA